MNTKDTIRPIKKAGYSSSTLHAKRDRKRREAEERNAHWAALTPEVQLKFLRSRPGNSDRQRARIVATIEAHQYFQSARK